MTCKTCKWLDVPPNKAGKIVAYQREIYNCAAADIERPKLPNAITEHWGFKWPPSRRRMGPSDGADCPTYEPRKP